MAIATAFDAAKGQMNFCPDAGQIDVAHAVFAFVAIHAPAAEIFGDDGHRQAVTGVVVDSDRLFVVFKRNERHVRTEGLFAYRARLGLIVLPIDERTEEIAAGTLVDIDDNGIPDECVAPTIPAVSEWGLLVCALVLLGAGTAILRRPARS